MSIPINMLNHLERLKDSGMPERQAKVIMEIFAWFAELFVTKEEFQREMTLLKQELKQELRHEIQEIKRDMKELEMRMTIKLGIMLVAVSSVMTSVIVTFIKVL